MHNNQQQIAENFSGGDFKAVYDYFSDNVQWTIIGDKTISGKDATITFCDKMLVEIAGSTLTNCNTITGSDQVVVEGYCKYTDTENKAMQVQYCDLYKFSDGKLEAITSYCITSQAS